MLKLSDGDDVRRRRQCRQIAGVNSLETKNLFGKYVREASVLPIYDGGNMDDRYTEFDKSMESIATIRTLYRRTRPTKFFRRWNGDALRQPA